jgi:hypothetical protein
MHGDRSRRHLNHIIKPIADSTKALNSNIEKLVDGLLASGSDVSVRRASAGQAPAGGDDARIGRLEESIIGLNQNMEAMMGMLQQMQQQQQPPQQQPPQQQPPQQQQQQQPPPRQQRSGKKR